jgi:hypothetical protein
MGMRRFCKAHGPLGTELQRTIARRIDGIERAFKTTLLEIGLSLQEAFETRAAVKTELRIRRVLCCRRKLHATTPGRLPNVNVDRDSDRVVAAA